MLLPESISKSNETFNRLNTNIKNNLLSNKIKQDKFFNAFKNVKWHIKSAGRNYNTVGETQGLFNGANEDGKRTILDNYNKKYKKTLYLVCCNLIKNKELLDKLFSAIELSEKNSENMRMHKMYFEALMNYIVIKCLEGDVEIGNNIFKFSTKNSIFLSNINDAIDVVSRHIKDGQKAKLTSGQSKIEKEMIELFSLNDSNISLQDATADINDKALEDTGMNYVDVLEKRDNIITTIDKAFDNMQGAPEQGLGVVVNNKTYSQKADVMKALKEVSEKIFSSQNTSADLVKKFINERVITQMEDTVKTKQNINTAVQGTGWIQDPPNDSDCTTKYYTNIAPGNNLHDVSYDLDNMRKNGVSNRALQDDEFRKRLDEEIKAKLKENKYFFADNIARGGLGIPPLARIPAEGGHGRIDAGHPFGDAAANDALGDDSLGNVYTKGEPHIANEKAMSYIEEHYITYLKQRLKVFSKASDLQKNDDTKWIGDVIVDLKLGLWVKDKDKDLDIFIDDIVDYAKRLFEDVGYSVDEKIKKEFLTEIIKKINEKSLNMREIPQLKETTKDIFSRVINSVSNCESEEEIKKLQNDFLKDKILGYKRVSDVNVEQFNNFFDKGKRFIAGVLDETGNRFDNWQVGSEPIRDGVDELKNMLLAKITDKRELFNVSRAVLGMVRYIYNGTDDLDNKINRFSIFSNFVKKCLSDDNTQDIINYAKIHLPDFYNSLAGNGVGADNVDQQQSNDPLRVARLYEVLFGTSVEIPDGQIDTCLNDIDTKCLNDGMSNIVRGTIGQHNGKFTNFTYKDNAGNGNIVKYTAYKRLSEGLKYLLVGNYNKFQACFNLSNNANGALSGDRKKFTSQFVGAGPGANNADAAAANDHALVAAMYNVLHDDAIANRYNLTRKNIDGVLSFLQSNDKAVEMSAERDKSTVARKLQISLDGDTNAIKKIIKMCDKEAKALLPNVKNYFRVINTPSETGIIEGVDHNTNADKKLHMLMLSSDAVNVDNDVTHGIQPFANYKDNGEPIDVSLIDNNKFIENGIQPTSLFFQHNKSRNKFNGTYNHFEITESADEVINPAVKQIVLRGVKQDNAGWWNVSDVAKLTKLAEQYRLTENDVDDLLDACPFLLGSFDIDVCEAYLNATKDILKDSPDLIRQYKQQLVYVYDKIYTHARKINFGNPVRIDIGNIKRAMLSLLTKCQNAHQLYAIGNMLEKAKDADKGGIFNSIVDGSIMQQLPALNEKKKADQQIKINKDGQEYTLSVLKTEMQGDPKRKDGLRNIRVKFLDRDGSFSNVFGAIDNNYKVYLDFYQNTDLEKQDTGKIVIAGKMDDYGVRYVKELQFNDNKAVFNQLKEMYTTDVYYDNDKTTHNISVNKIGQLMDGNEVIFTLDSKYVKRGTEFLQTLSVWKDVFGCKNQIELRQIARQICDIWQDDEKSKDLLNRLTKLLDSVRDTRYQDILRLLRDDGYSYIMCPLNEERRNMIVELVKFKRDFIVSHVNECDRCDALIEKLQGSEDVSLCSMNDCKKLLSFISPSAIIIDNVDFLKGGSDVIGKKIDGDKGNVSGGIWRKKNKKIKGNDDSNDDNNEEENDEKEQSEDQKNRKDKDKEDKKEQKQAESEEEKNKEEEDNLQEEKLEEDSQATKQKHKSVFDRFRIKEDNNVVNDDFVSKSNNFSQVTDYFDKRIKNQVAIAKKQPQLRGTNVYSNTSSVSTEYGGNIFNEIANQNYNNYINNVPQRQFVKPGGALINMFKNTYVSPRRSRRQNFFFEKQAQQNKTQQNYPVWTKGNGNFLQESQIGRYVGNRGINSFYNGLQTRNMNNASSYIHNQPSGLTWLFN